jgi:hypothetical protein
VKIPLNMGNQNGALQSGAALNRALEGDILSAQRGDWNAKHALERTFMPLLTSLGEKKTSDTAKLNRYIEAGKGGLAEAVKKYRAKIGPEKFRIFALDFIQSAMDGVDQGSGFWARLFGRR